MHPEDVKRIYHIYASTTKDREATAVYSTLLPFIQVCCPNAVVCGGQTAVQVRAFPNIKGGVIADPTCVPL